MKNDIEYFKVNSLAELYALEEYVPVVDFSDKSVRQISLLISPYYFSKKDQLKCGIKACRQWHQKGFLARTTDGILTNIGHDCGSNFIENFDQERVNLEIREKRRRGIATLTKFLTEAQEIHRWIKEAQDFCGEYTKFVLSLDRKTNEALTEMCKARRTRILSDDRLKVSDAKSLYESINPKIGFDEWLISERPNVSSLRLVIKGVTAFNYGFSSQIKTLHGLMMKLDSISLPQNLNNEEVQNATEIISLIHSTKKKIEEEIIKGQLIMNTDPLIFTFLPGVYR